MPKSRRTILLLAYLLYAGLCYSQNLSDLRFSNIDNIEGLESNHFNAILEDGLGFIWMATNDGLYRYESSGNFTVFNTNNTEALKSGYIRTIYFDSKDNLWVGTRLGGLSLLNLKTNTWKTYLHHKNDPNSISDNEILTIKEDRKGRIWIGTENGLNLFVPEADNFVQFLPDEKDPWSLSSRAVLTIIEDDKGWIWTGNWAGGLNLLVPSINNDISETKFISFLPEQNTPAHNVWKIFQDKDNRYWIATYGGGLFLMQLPDTATNDSSQRNWNKWKPTFHRYSKSEGDFFTISSNQVQDILQDENGNLWIGTAYGLNIIKNEELNQLAKGSSVTGKTNIRFYRNLYDQNSDHTIIHNNIVNLFEDKQGLIWLCTFSGISQYNWTQNQFEIYKFLGKDIETSQVSGIYVTENTLWIGSPIDGLVRVNMLTGKKNYINDQFKGLLLDKFVSCISKKDASSFFVCSRTGIQVVDKHLKLSEKYPFPDWIIKQNNLMTVRDLLYTDSTVWMATDIGVIVFDETNGTFKQYKQNNKQGSISDNSVHAIFKDSDGAIWVSTYNGLNKGFKKNDEFEFTIIKHDAENVEMTPPTNRITAIAELDRKLYFGSSNGMFLYDMDSRKFHELKNLGLKHLIRSLKVTKNKQIWGNSNKGIFFLDPISKEVNVFQERDGLIDLSFNANSIVENKEGKLFFGSQKGVTILAPNNIILNSVQPANYITDIRIMGPNLDTLLNGVYKKEIALNHDDYYLSLNFSNLNYNRPDKNRYAYMLEGFSDEWVYTNKNLSAVYTNLDAGTYVFRVKSSNNDGLWDNEGVSLKIIKHPAFWETWWFRLLSLSLIVLSVIVGFKYYTQKMKRRNLELNKYNQQLNIEISERKRVEKALQESQLYLESLVKQRTAELEVKNEEVKNLNKKLLLRNEELEVIVEKRTQNLRASNEELIRSNEDLEQFAYIASHDLQEPLRVIGNFVGLLKRRYYKKLDKEAIEYIDFTVDGVRRMSALIRSVLVYSRVGRREQNFGIARVDKLIESKLCDLKQMIQEKNAKVHIEPLPKIYCDNSQLAMVFYNLINNAIKFNKTEQPEVSVGYSEDSSGYWIFSVKDNGIGISKENQQKIFEIFKRLHAKKDYEGTGIGLSLCKKIIHQHGGKIWVESEEGKGATFMFSIDKNLKDKIQSPLTNQDFLKSVHN